jgi:hypothetical protein
MRSFMERVKLEKARLAELDADPFRERTAAAVKGKEAISTAALLDLLEVPKTVANARRIAKTMRALDFVPVKSRKFLPGGFRDTVSRGWGRPLREER